MTTGEMPMTASPGRRLRALLESPGLEFAMSAHDAVSARIVEGEGFPGIWASGLSVSSVLGARDSNEVSWSQLVEVVRCMADVTTAPILVDGDTGYGNFNNARLLVRQLCQAGAAGVALEDKVFPKTNSFVGDGHELADVDEFCGKLHACRDSCPDEDFVVVARTETLIAGGSVDEAIERSEAYRQAGADAVLIHSRSRDAGEIVDFAHAWGDRLPLVIVPTTYAAAGTDVFRDAGISLAIWGNHTLRAAMRAMQLLCREVRRVSTVTTVEGELATLPELFALFDYSELEEAHERYLPATTPVGALR